MASGTMPASFPGLKTRDPGFGFAKSVDFVKVSDMRRSMPGRRRAFVVRNSNSGSDIAELQPASEGSPLLGIHCFYHSMLCFLLSEGSTLFCRFVIAVQSFFIK